MKWDLGLLTLKLNVASHVTILEDMTLESGALRLDFASILIHFTSFYKLSFIIQICYLLFDNKHASLLSFIFVVIIPVAIQQYLRQNKSKCNYMSQMAFKTMFLEFASF